MAKRASLRLEAMTLDSFGEAKPTCILFTRHRA